MGLTGTSASEGLEALGGRARKHILQQMGESEEAYFSLRGEWGQALVALADRLIIVKSGALAGATFGAKVTTFYYTDIAGIETKMGLTRGYIEVNSPAFASSVPKRVWSSSKKRDPAQVPNCLPVTRTDVAAFKPYLDQLRQMIGAAKQGRTLPRPPSKAVKRFPSPVPHVQSEERRAELKKLTSLRDSGHLSFAEFERAKDQLERRRS